MKNLMFVSNILPMEVINRMKRSVAGAQCQVSFAQGMKHHIDGEFELLSVVRSGNKEAKEWCNNIVFDEQQYTPIRHFSKPYLEELLCSIQVFFRVLRWSRKKENRKVIVLNAPNEVMTALLWVKKIRGIEIYSFLMDSPFTNKELTSRYLKWKKREYEKGLKKLNKCDGVILLNKHVLDILNLSIPALTILLGYEPFDIPYKANHYCGMRHRKKRVMYAGSLSHVNGTAPMLAALDRLSPDEYDIIICGQGPDEQMVRDFADSHSNCIFYGRVEQETLNKLYAEADLMMNLRLPDNDDNDFSFPSKLISYLYSGKAVLSSDFSSLPDDYRELLYVVEDLSPQVVADEIERILSIGELELNAVAAKAREFVKQNQQWTDVTREVSRFIWNEGKIYE